jgi:colanic acid/amylovoran biosynthesis glycosyltransferase
VSPISPPSSNAAQGAAGELPEVAVFRHNLFKVSEVFITEQARHFRAYHPFFLGRLRQGPVPAGVESVALADLAPGLALPMAGWQMLSRGIGPYERLLAGRRPALIHAHFGIEGVYALPLAEKLRVPLVTTFHGFDATLSTAGFFASPAWAWYPLLRRRLAREGNLFLCASNFIRERLLAQGFVPERTRVHYIGVDCAAIVPRLAGEEEPVILHVARLVEVKGTEYLLRAFAALGPRHAAARLVIIGDGPLRARLERLARQAGVAERVAFLGALPHAQVLGWMRRAAVLVLPSVRTAAGRVEGLGMVTLEAAATGVPAIGSNLGGITETIVDGETGFLVPERDAAALAARMGEVLSDAALRRTMGIAARQRVERGFDITRQTAALETMYDEARAG